MAVIGVEAGFLRPGKVGGAEHMLRNLISGLNLSRDSQTELEILSDISWDVPGIQKNLRWRKLRGNGNRFVRAWWTVLQCMADMDAILFPNYFTPPLPRLKHSPTFVTVIHDLLYRHFPSSFSQRKRAWLQYAHRSTMKRADHVVVISEFVRKDVLSAYGSRWEDKVHVVANPVSWERFSGSRELSWEALAERVGMASRPYILTVAAHYPHKNLASLIRAHQILVTRGGFADVALVLVGQASSNLVGISQSEDVSRLVRESDLTSSVYMTGYVTDAELGALYEHAQVFAFPSLFEGFGLPPVEALGFGLPVLTTRHASIPECTMGLAHYVENARDPFAIAHEMEEILKNPEPYKPSHEAIHQLKEHYAPERIGREYYALLLGRKTFEIS